MISRRQFVARASAAGLALSVAPFSASPARAASAQPDDRFQDLLRGVGAFSERGGTIGYLATEAGLVIVDTQFPESARACYDRLDARTPDRATPINLLVNTHHHGDHTAGNVALAGLAARHVAHEAVPGLQRAAAVRGGSQDAQTYPRETYSCEWSADVGDETIALRYHGPAHTAGDSVVHFERADVVHMGDLVFNRMPCFIDLPAGATTEGWMDVLQRVHDDFSDETAFIFGHGHPDHGVVGTRADLLVMRDYLGELRQFVSAGRAAGMTEDEMVAESETHAPFDSHRFAGWPQGLPNNVRAVAEEMAR